MAKRLWVESIKHFPAEIQESLILEQPHTKLVEPIPANLGLDFLTDAGGMIDLGFENLGLSKDDFKKLSWAFSGNGVLIPDSRDVFSNVENGWKLRNVRPMHAIFEPADGDEVSLPGNWVESILMLNSHNQIHFIGNRVRPDQLGPIDWANYLVKNTRWGVGWLLKFKQIDDS